VEHRPGSSTPNPDEIAGVQAQADAGDLDGAVRTWQFSDPVYCNPRGLHTEYLSTLPFEERLDGYDPEEWGFIQAEELARLLAERAGKPQGPVQ
jgi:hypothetical protein